MSDDGLRPSVAEIERDEAIARAEKAEADLAAAREVLVEMDKIVANLRAGK
jgi:hypothetical protein